MNHTALKYTLAALALAHMLGCGEEEAGFTLPLPPSPGETGSPEDAETGEEDGSGSDASETGEPLDVVETGEETSAPDAETGEDTGDVLETGEDSEESDADAVESGEESGEPDVIETGEETGEPDIIDPPEDTTEPPPPVDLCELIPSPCLTEGVCIAGVKSSCKDGEWTCSYQFVADYEPEETLCDGKDNDCDGAIDEALIDAAASTCPSVGACATGVFTFCHLGSWHCDYAAVLDHEPVESSCDGLDNDCDGETDELTNLGSEGCKTQGVCDGTVEAQCVNGEILCEYADAGAAYEAVETLCDGKDNDCDGYVDNLTVVGVTETDCVPGDGAAGPCCDTEGACAGTVTANCVATTWICEYAAVNSHEPNGEVTCDGLDNDCDGEIDENLDPATSGCPQLGVCTAVTATCEEGAWNCHLDTLLNHEVGTETLCDNLDNDCDGETDEALLAAANAETVECPTLGVCESGVGAMCVGGAWECDFSPLADHESEELSCDNKDNDCDGETDEDIDIPTGSTEGCEQFGVGVCSNFAEFTCEGGVITCDFTAIPTFEEVEISCDGLDNNCNGLTDENMANVPDLSVTTCPSLGVCGENVQASCIDGDWECSFGEVTDFEEGTETLCDNKDNDCDGLVDEGLTDPSASDCKTEGVCASDVLVACSEGEWLCDYSAIPAFSGEFEYLCDGVDNNCDGSVDEDSCQLLDPCLDDAQCVTGGCRATPDGNASYCAPGADCVLENEDGNVETVPPATSACAGDSASSSCVIGNWTTPVPCDESAPVCINASCVICIPSSLDCEDADTRIVCDTEGSGYSPTAGCAGSTACVGTGSCVSPNESSANGPPIETERTRPFVTDFPDGDFILGWTQSPPEDAGDIHGRRFSDLGNAIGSEVVLNELTSGAQRNASAISANGGDTFVLVWQSILPTGFDGVFSRRFVANSLTTLSDAVDIGTFTTKSHERPRIAALPDGGAIITWELVSTNGSADIYGQLLDAFGNKNGSPFKVSTSSLSGDNRRPDAAALPDGRFVVVWESGNSGQTSIAMQRFKANGDKQGGKITVSDGGSGPATHPRVEPLPDATLAIVWEKASTAIAPRDVHLRFFNSAGFAQGPSQVVHPVTDGDQRDPVVAVAGSVAVIVAWADSDSGTTDGADIHARAFTSGGDSLGDVIVVNTETNGDQTQPAIAAYKDGRVIATWRSGITEDTADTQYRIFDFSY